ncbi:MAG: hypothetical protein ACHP6I_01745 [Rickettsiales bacterium]
MKQSTITKLLMKKSDIDDHSEYLQEEFQRYYRLYHAIISETFADACIVQNSRHQKFIRKGATYWLLKDNVDFPKICQHAGLQPDAIRKKAQLMLLRYENYFKQARGESLTSPKAQSVSNNHQRGSGHQNRRNNRRGVAKHSKWNG